MWTKAAFGLTMMVICQPGLAGAAVYDSGGSNSLMNRLESANVAAYHGRLTEAIAADNLVIADSPDFGVAYLARADHLAAAGRFVEAQADVEHAFAMHPDAREIQVQLVRLALLQGDGKKALDGIKNAAKMQMTSFWHSPFEAGIYEYGDGHMHSSTQHMITTLTAYGSIAELLTHNVDGALADLDAMMKMEPAEPWHVLNDYCYISAVDGQLDMAELTCEESISDNAHDSGQYDSLGFTHLRMKAWAKAIADYTKALSSRGDLTYSLYGRGIAKRAIGDTAGGDADIAAATKNEPDIANIMKRLGAPVGS